MIPINQSIEADVIRSAGLPQGISRRGVVRAVNGSTAVITFSSDTIAVNLTQGTLREGEEVAVTVLNDKCVIQKIAHTAPVLPAPNPAYTVADTSKHEFDDLKVILQHIAKTIESRSDILIDGEIPQDGEAAVLQDGEKTVKNQEIRAQALQIIDRVSQILNTAQPDKSAQIQAVIDEIFNIAVKISIESLPDQFRMQTSELLTALAKLVSLLKPQSGTQNNQFTISPEYPVSPGLLYFEDISDVEEWISQNNAGLNKETGSEFAAPYSKGISQPDNFESLRSVFFQKPVVVSVADSGNGKQIAAVLSVPEAFSEMSQFLKNEMKSSLMHELPRSVLQDILKLAGSLSLGVLRNFDSFLAVYEQENPDIAPLTDRSAAITVTQAVLLLMENTDAVGRQLSPALYTGTGKIAETGLDLAAKLGLEDIVPGKFHISESAIAEFDSVQPAILKLFNDIGFTFESKMASSNTGNAENSREFVSLKLFLLMVLREIENIRNRPQGPETDSPAERSSVHRRISPLARTVAERIIALDIRHDTSLLDSIHSRILTALDRLESAQLIAKQVSSSEGRQQVVSLPMRIDNEWVEARIRFVKRKAAGRSVSKDKRRFTVALTVCPSFLGQISADIDYTKDRAMLIGMAFEKDGARSWFEKHKGEFLESLRRFGPGGLTLKISSARPEKAVSGILPESHNKEISTLELWG